jgi:hypothetical protein
VALMRAAPRELISTFSFDSNAIKHRRFVSSSVGMFRGINSYALPADQHCSIADFSFGQLLGVAEPFA